MLYLKADTAVEIPIGPAVAVGDGFTPVTTLTIAGADEAELLKFNGSTAIATSAITGTLAAITGADGYYTLDLGTGDVDTEGFLVVLINDDSLILPIRHEFMVVSANVYDSLFAASGTDVLDTNVTQWLGTAAATPTVAGVPEVDVTHWIGTAAATPTTAGVPEVDVTFWAGIGATVSGGLPNVNVAGWRETQPAVGATSGFPVVDTQAVSDDTAAADNLELDYDGTGFNKANSTIGTTTTNTDMRGTDNAALASVLGALSDSAAAGDPTSADTAMQYVKQLVNVLVGSDGVTTFPAEAAPANAVSLAEVIRAIHTDVTGLNGDAMRGTDSALLAASAPTNWSSFSIDGSGRVDVGAWLGTAVTVSGGLPNTNVAGWDETSVSVGATSTFPVVDAQAISDDTAAADLLEALMDGAVLAQVNDASATTTAFAADGFTEATDDHFKGRLITFVTGALTGQQTDITGYDASGGAQGSQQFTVTALTEAPANDVFFVIH